MPSGIYAFSYMIFSKDCFVMTNFLKKLCIRTHNKHVTTVIYNRSDSGLYHKRAMTIIFASNSVALWSRKSKNVNLHDLNVMKLVFETYILFQWSPLL